MSVENWDKLPYLAIRFAFWALAWFASIADFVRYRGEKVHGWQLHRCIFAVLCAMVLKEAATLAWKITNPNDPQVEIVGKDYGYYVLIVLYNIADASFLCLLMVISWGWQITRQTIAEGRVPIFAIPLVNFIAILIHDIVYELAGGHTKACYIRVSRWKADVLLVCALVYLFTIMYMWLWIFQALKIEKGRLELQLAVGVGRQNPGTDDHELEPRPSMADAASLGVDPITGGPMEPHMREAIIGNDDSNPDLPVRVTAEGIFDTDDDTTMPMHAKLRLLGRFFEAVSFFFAATFTVVVFNVWTAKCERDDHGTPVRVIDITRTVLLVVHDIIYFVFLVALIYLFRLRQSNPYYMLADYTADDNEPTNEHGV